jgi:hypothetical protein
MLNPSLGIHSFWQIDTPRLQLSGNQSPKLENASTFLQEFSIPNNTESGDRKFNQPNECVLLPSKDLLRLNDALQSCGLRSLPRDANIKDVVYGSIEAINELVSRASSEPQPCRDFPMKTETHSIHPSRNVEKLRETEQALDKLSAQCENLSSENKELRKLVMQWKSEANSVKHLLNAKEKEVDKLRISLKDKASEDDKRAALSMTTIREQNMPHSSLLLLNQLQKRISDLEQENTILAKRNTRLRHSESNKQTADDLGRLMKENELLASQLEHSKAQFSEMERKYYSVVEETNLERKTANKESDFISQITRILGEDRNQAFKTIKDMQRIVTEIFPPIDSFVTRVTRMVDPGHTGPISEPVLANALDRVIQWAQDSGELSTLMEAKSLGPLTEEERVELARLKSLQQCVRSTFGLHETHSDSLIPYLGRVKFKLDEFRNFYKQACVVLGMRIEDKIPTYAAFMEEMKKQLGQSDTLNVSGNRSVRRPRRN